MMFQDSVTEDSRDTKIRETLSSSHDVKIKEAFRSSPVTQMQFHRLSFIISVTPYEDLLTALLWLESF